MQIAMLTMLAIAYELVWHVNASNANCKYAQLHALLSLVAYSKQMQINASLLCYTPC
jgi:hypothetical protein